MRKGIIFAFILILASSFVMADNTYFQGGAGGFETIYLPLDLNKIDVKLNNIRLPELPNNVYLTGGGGWGNVGNNVRIGGFGYGGSIPAISSKNQEITREFDMEISFGGLTVEKAFHPFSFGEITMGFVVGGGAIKLELNRWSDFPTWENVWEGYTSESNVDNVTPVSYSSQIKTQFFAASPSLGFRYNLLDWFAVGANLGYLYTYSKNDNWKINGNDLYDAPNIDMSSIIYKVNFLFGG